MRLPPFILLLLAWLVAWIAFHVTSAAIHILLAAAVIALILLFVRGSRRAGA